MLRNLTLFAETVVTLETLKKYRMIDDSVSRVKVLGQGTVTVRLTLKVPASKSAKESILSTRTAKAE